MIYAPILPPFSSNFLPGSHYVYALDYDAIFPQFRVSLPHYAYYTSTLWINMHHFKQDDLLTNDFSEHFLLVLVCKHLNGLKSDHRLKT